MKVSRKVGRRSRSSISRRRFRNKNRKHAKTQKGGKYVKRGRGHKRARTYKHGKRFHKGGVLSFFSRGKITSFDPTTGVITNLNYTKTHRGESLSNRHDNFKVGTSGQGDKTTIFFTRTPEMSGKPLQFMFGPSERSVTINQMRSALTFHGVITKGDIEYTLLGDEELFDSIKKYLFPPVATPVAAASAPLAAAVDAAAVDAAAVDAAADDYDAPAPAPAPAPPREFKVQILPSPEGLPSGWVKVVDDVEGVYYRTTTIKDKQGKPIIKKTMPTEAPDVMYPQYASVTSDEDFSAPSEAVVDDDEKFSAAPPAPASENTSTLPEGWEMYIHDATGKPYYHNSERGKTTWDLPSNDD